MIVELGVCLFWLTAVLTQAAESCLPAPPLQSWVTELDLSTVFVLLAFLIELYYMGYCVEQPIQVCPSILVSEILVFSLYTVTTLFAKQHCYC